MTKQPTGSKRTRTMESIDDDLGGVDLPSMPSLDSNPLPNEGRKVKEPRTSRSGRLQTLRGESVDMRPNHPIPRSIEPADFEALQPTQTLPDVQNHRRQDSPFMEQRGTQPRYGVTGMPMSHNQMISQDQYRGTGQYESRNRRIDREDEYRGVDQPASRYLQNGGAARYLQGRRYIPAEHFDSRPQFSPYSQEYHPNQVPQSSTHSQFAGPYGGNVSRSNEHGSQQYRHPNDRASHQPSRHDLNNSSLSRSMVSSLPPNVSSQPRIPRERNLSLPEAGGNSSLQTESIDDLEKEVENGGFLGALGSSESLDYGDDY